jgi:hypothetical protein
MAREELSINVSADPSGGNNNYGFQQGRATSYYGGNNNTLQLPPSNLPPEHYGASRPPPQNPLIDRWRMSQSPHPSIPEHAVSSLRTGVYSKESFRDYNGSIITETQPSRHSSFNSGPSTTSPPPMSYHSTTPFLQAQSSTRSKLQNSENTEHHENHHHRRQQSQSDGAPKAKTRASVVSMGTGGTGGGTQATVTTAISAAIEADPSNGWRPSWLRKRIMGIFVGVFVALGACAEIVMAVVDGQVANMSVEGVWIFGPVIVISIVAALWWMVEFQALNYTPWIVLDIDQGKGFHGAGTKKRRASRTIMLDYVSMSYPQALFKAIRNQHYLVAASVATSLLLRAEIFLSTAIFHVRGGENADTPRTLILQPVIVHAMVAIFGLVALLTLGMIFSAPGRHGITPRDPTTIAGTAALLSNSYQPMSRVSATGSQGMDVVAQKLRGSWCTTLLHQPNARPTYEFRLELFESQVIVKSEKYVDETEQFGRPYHPWSHQAWASIFTLVFSFLLLAGLWVIFAIRGPDRRFKAEYDAYFLWTSLVTLCFVVLSMFVSSVSFHVQRLAPFFKLLGRACTYDESLGLNYTNTLGIKAFLRSWRHKDWGVAITTAVAFVAWLLPIFSAGLFADKQIERIANVELQQQSFIKSDINTNDFKTDESLVQRVLLDTKPSYPAWTYEDLVYPKLHLAGAKQEHWDSSNKQISAKVPVTKANLECRTVTLTREQASDLKCKSLMGDNKEREVVDCGSGNDYFGVALASCSDLEYEATFNYAWGGCSKDSSISVLMCDEKVVVLTAETTLTGDDLAISKTSPPVADERTKDSTEIRLGTDRAYELLRGTAPNKDTQGLDDFFAVLVSSRLDVNLKRLGSLERANSVQQAIQQLHGIVRALALNSDAARTSAGDMPPPINAELAYYVLNVIQSTAQTALLTASLAIIALLTLVWLLFFKPSPAALPKNPSSIAALASLLADSSLWWHLPRGVEWLREDKLARRLRRKTFRLGWFEVMAPGPDGTTVTDRACTIGVVQDNGRAMRAPWDEGEAWTGSSRRGADWRRP